MLRLGSKNVSKLFLGGRAIANAYLGNKLVWPSSPPIHFVTAIESDGVACTVVPHVQQNVENAKVRMVFRLPQVLDGNSPLRDKNMFGYSLNDSRWCINNYNPYDSRPSAKHVVCQIYSGSGMSAQFPWTDYSTTQYHELVVTRINGQIQVFMDNILVRSSTNSTTPVMGRYGVFTQNDIDGDGVNPISGRTPSGVAIAEFDTWDGGILATSLRACLDESNVPCFYDLVSETYVRTVSGGSFIVAS